MRNTPASIRCWTGILALTLGLKFSSLGATATWLGPSGGDWNTFGANLVMNCSGGTTNSAYYLLTSTNLFQWSLLATVYFDAGGNLVVTDSISPSTVTRFYRLRSP